MTQVTVVTHWRKRQGVNEDFGIENETCCSLQFNTLASFQCADLSGILAVRTTTPLVLNPVEHSFMHRLKHLFSSKS